MKKFGLILIVLLAISLLSGCGEQEVVSEDQQPAVTEGNIDVESLLNVNENPTYDDSADLMKLDEAVAGELDLGKCNSIEDEVLKAFCIKDIITTMAMNNDDASKCLELTTDEDKQYCLDKVASLKGDQ